MSYIDRKNFKYLPVLILFGVIPDLDVLIGIHRATFHNIFIAVAPLLFWFICRKLKIKRLEKKQIFFCLASGFLILHIILDIFCGGVFVFYPAYQENIDCSSSFVLTQKEIMSPEPKNITDISPNITELHKNETQITNVTSPPLAPNITIPTPAPKTYYNLDIEIKHNEPKNVNEVNNYTIVPSKNHSKPIINNGVELIFLITAGFACLVRYFELNAC
jgi:hypothetical protein